ncbi:MAG: ferritin-like protein [Ferruginibacter sp.]|nr:ferritin-like protein [Ferruginibacter sp.]
MTTKKSSFSSIPDDDPIVEGDVSKEFLNFLCDELKDIYSGEKNLAKALPKMQKATANKVLKNILESQFASAQLHLERLEQIFELLGECAKVKPSEAMAALLEEANSSIEKTTRSSRLRDAAIILAIQKIRHYEMATYNILVQLARTLGNEDIISLLEETLNDENKADDLVNSFAEENYNTPLPAGKNTQTEKGEEKVATVYRSKNLEGKKTIKKEKE